MSQVQRKKLKPIHHEIMRRLLLGYSQAKIARDLLIHPNTISIVCNSKLFKAKYEQLKLLRDAKALEGALDVQSRVNLLVPDALDVLGNLIREEGAAPNLRRLAAKDVLEYSKKLSTEDEEQGENLSTAELIMKAFEKGSDLRKNIVKEVKEENKVVDIRPVLNEIKDGVVDVVEVKDDDGDDESESELDEVLMDPNFTEEDAKKQLAEYEASLSLEEEEEFKDGEREKERENQNNSTNLSLLDDITSYSEVESESELESEEDRFESEEDEDEDEDENENEEDEDKREENDAALTATLNALLRLSTTTESNRLEAMHTLEKMDAAENSSEIRWMRILQETEKMRAIFESLEELEMSGEIEKEDKEILDEIRNIF